MSLRFGSVTVTVASSPTTAQEILQKKDQSFANRPIPESVAAQPNVNDTLAWARADSRWRNRRRICTTQIFTTQRLDLLQHLRHRKVEQLIQHLHKKAAEKTTVDIGELAFATMLNLVSNTVFSEDLVDSEFESASEFKAKLGPNVEADNKKNNEKSYKDAEKAAKDFDGGLKNEKKGELPPKEDYNRTTIDYNPRTEVSKEQKDNWNAQAKGYTSKLEEENGIEKGGADRL
jgi:cytochrome P450